MKLANCCVGSACSNVVIPDRVYVAYLRTWSSSPAFSCKVPELSSNLTAMLKCHLQSKDGNFF